MNFINIFQIFIITVFHIWRDFPDILLFTKYYIYFYNIFYLYIAWCLKTDVGMLFLLINFESVQLAVHRNDIKWYEVT